ncbi:MAG: DUF2207 domain-containing protein [Propionibacteriaceae bacterium]|nr:DUF2207 domain-containing protein [Micropruina sp.]
MKSLPKALRVLLPLAGALALGVGPLALTATAADAVDTMTVQATVDEAGTLAVSETFTFSGAAPASFTQRLANTLPALDSRTYRYVISDVKSTTSGVTVSTSVTADDYTQVTVNTGGAAAPVTVSYAVKGAALKESATATTIRWRLLQGLSLPVNTFDATLTGPGIPTFVTCEAGPPAAPGACGYYAAATHDNPQPVFHNGALGAGEMVGAAVRYPSISVAPNEDLRETWTLDRAFSATPLTLGVAAGLAALGGLVFWLLHRRYGADAQTSALPTTIAEFRPVGVGQSKFTVVDGVRPGHVGTVLDERVDPIDVTATLLDLAVRGYLVIEQLPADSSHALTDWAFNRGTASGDLRDFERTLLDAVAPSDGERVLVSTLPAAVGPIVGKVQEELYADVVKRGWFARRPDQIRGSWTTAGWVALAVAVVAALVLAAFTRFGLVGLVLIGLALGLVFVAASMPARTASGAALLNGLGVLRGQLLTHPTTQVPKGGELAELSAILPYAVVLGGSERWLAAFADADVDDSSDGDDLGWFVVHGDWHLSDLPASLTNFFTTIQGTLFRRN